MASSVPSTAFPCSPRIIGFLGLSIVASEDFHFDGFIEGMSSSLDPQRSNSDLLKYVFSTNRIPVAWIDGS